MTDQTIQQLNLLLNTEVTPQQLKKIDPTYDYLIKVTKRSKNNRVTHGILLVYGGALSIKLAQDQYPELRNTELYYIVKHNPPVSIISPGIIP